MEALEDSVGDFFRRRIPKRYKIFSRVLKEFCLHLRCVAIGLRRGFLFDMHALVTMDERRGVYLDQFQLFTDMLEEIQKRIAADIFLLRIEGAFGEDLYFLHRPLVLSNKKCPLIYQLVESPPSFRQLQAQQFLNLNKSFQDILASLHENLESTSCKSYSIDTRDSFPAHLLPTLCGWLVDYPIVYALQEAAFHQSVVNPQDVYLVKFLVSWTDDASQLTFMQFSIPKDNVCVLSVENRVLELRERFPHLRIEHQVLPCLVSSVLRL